MATLTITFADLEGRWLPGVGADVCSRERWGCVWVLGKGTQDVREHVGGEGWRPGGYATGGCWWLGCLTGKPTPWKRVKAFRIVEKKTGLGTHCTSLAWSALTMTFDDFGGTVAREHRHSRSPAESTAMLCGV